jgi:hypothetical protein
MPPPVVSLTPSHPLTPWHPAAPRPLFPPQASDVVQQEDIGLCEAVQGGLASPGYDVGRYAPELEGPMFAFHQLLYRQVGPSLGLAG